MDDMVKAALRKWPNVPDCRGWLGLDARGDWYMRDERTQAAGPFPRSKGSRIEHDKLRDFIGRNYEADAQGAWFFQNGPQRVYVELEITPWVWRLHSEGAGGVVVRAHTGAVAGPVLGVWLDELGRVFLHTPLGLGLIHSLDTHWAAEEVEAGRWCPQDVAASALPRQFGFEPRPAACHGANT